MVYFNNAAINCCFLKKDVKTLADLKTIGVKIMFCGICLDSYELNDWAEVGEVSNMYEIVSSINSVHYVRV